eukprot:6818390-Prymnesium_polylepis.1
MAFQRDLFGTDPFANAHITGRKTQIGDATKKEESDYDAAFHHERRAEARAKELSLNVRDSCKGEGSSRPRGAQGLRISVAR